MNILKVGEVLSLQMTSRGGLPAKILKFQSEHLQKYRKYIEIHVKYTYNRGDNCDGHTGTVNRKNQSSCKYVLQYTTCEKYTDTNPFSTIQKYLSTNIQLLKQTQKIHNLLRDFQ